MFQNRSGATAIEYALIASLISVAAIVAFQLLGDSLDGVWVAISNAMEAAL